jgi:hypothetical protein
MWSVYGPAPAVPGATVYGMTDETYRSQVITGLGDAQEAVDEWLLKLAAGALAIAIGFVRTEGRPSAAWALVASWVLLAGCVLCVVFSFRVSRNAFREALRQADDPTDPERLYRETPGGRDTVTTERLNDVALLLFVVGMICLGYFTATNIGNLR